MDKEKIQKAPPEVEKKSRIRRELESMQTLADIKQQRQLGRDVRKAAKRKERRIRWQQDQDEILKRDLEQLQAIPERQTPSSAHSRVTSGPGSRAQSRQTERLRDCEVSHAWTQTEADDDDRNMEQVMMQLKRKSLAEQKKMSRDLVDSPDQFEEPEDDHDIEFFKKLFKFLDQQKTGRLTYEELETPLRKIGFDLSLKEMKEMTASVSGAGRDYVTFPEFLKFCLDNQTTLDEDYVDIKEVFEQIDDNHKGYIEESDLIRTCAVNEIDLSKLQIEQMIMEADKNGDGHVTLQGFMKVMMQTNLF
ncbi:centrin-2-like [Lineus longissimus]|uniref:centrin-2-like n=1 Tax=Lineus longissimus TaxID=88925 RepID=UPI00315DB5B0